MYSAFEIPGRPIALARHRHVGKICYDPQRKVKDRVIAVFRGTFTGVVPAVCPTKLIVNYQMPIPRSCSKKRRMELMGTAHAVKPDLSNLVKFTEDVFNGIIWEDDSIICEIAATKVWGDRGMTSIGIVEG